MALVAGYWVGYDWGILYWDCHCVRGILLRYKQRTMLRPRKRRRTPKLVIQTDTVGPSSGTFGHHPNLVTSEGTYFVEHLGLPTEGDRRSGWDMDDGEVGLLFTRQDRTL